MPLHLGSAAVDAVRLGANAVDRIYLGSELVWPTAAPEVLTRTFSLTLGDPFFNGSALGWVDTAASAENGFPAWALDGRASITPDPINLAGILLAGSWTRIWPAPGVFGTGFRQTSLPALTLRYNGTDYPMSLNTPGNTARAVRWHTSALNRTGLSIGDTISITLTSDDARVVAIEAGTAPPANPLSRTFTITTSGTRTRRNAFVYNGWSNTASPGFFGAISPTPTELISAYRLRGLQPPRNNSVQIQARDSYSFPAGSRVWLTWGDEAEVELTGGGAGGTLPGSRSVSTGPRPSGSPWPSPTDGFQFTIRTNQAASGFIAVSS